MPNPILILATGGTFDKTYDPVAGTLAFGKTCVPALLQAGRCRKGLARVRTLMMKDSLEMTAADRRQILAACRAAKETRIVIIHGTDTLVETARVLGNELNKTLAGKTIVLTGAMVPHAVAGSDASFNLGSAIAFAKALPAGVRIAMNGELFAWDQAAKNRKLARFETK